MQLFKTETRIDFIGKRLIALVISAVLLSAGIYSLATKGLNFGIDFSGGTKVELIYQDTVQVSDIRSVLQQGGFTEAVVQYFGSDEDVLIRVPLSDETNDDKVSTRIVDLLAASAVGAGEVKSVEFVGPTFGKELFEKGILALVYALIGIMIYVAFRFEWKFSLGSVIALVHDVVITLGVFSLIQMEFTMPVLAALLAVIGYSLNDTIVVFDRIRENFRRLREVNTEQIMNTSINQTLPRTILTSLTTLLVLLALYVYGGEALQGFALTLIIGVVIGTYSSIFVASPSVLMLGAKPEDLIVEVVEKEGADQPSQYLP
ncbi:protein-export membrane protein SecF [Arenicella chitinivorans]|uniref:Protein-export membrane protein SecF n=1 Tax=Arenicella chitinivorans TaxID=1329800 RepID=A0A918RXM2_9GAMM|nr:protein translocase subunit SecF [Arenicella chitinivorans]GHA15227.1 protein-export membrane protein SecF [Arenicella chitinivorans]